MFSFRWLESVGLVPRDPITTGVAWGVIFPMQREPDPLAQSILALDAELSSGGWVDKADDEIDFWSTFEANSPVPIPQNPPSPQNIVPTLAYVSPPSSPQPSKKYN
jgi:hypothetical protein